MTETRRQALARTLGECHTALHGAHCTLDAADQMAQDAYHNPDRTADAASGANVYEGEVVDLHDLAVRSAELLGDLTDLRQRAGWTADAYDVTPEPGQACRLCGRVVADAERADNDGMCSACAFHERD